MVGRLLSALALLTATAAAASTAPPPQQIAWTRTALARLPATKADHAPERADLRSQQLDEFATAIAEVAAKQPRPREYAALLVTIGGIESNFDTQIVLGICAKWACDHGRAKGAFQSHSVSFTSDLWKVADGSPRVQVEMADRTLRRSLTRCAPFAPYPAHVFRAYRGGGDHSCSWAAPREAERVATYFRVLATAVKP